MSTPGTEPTPQREPGSEPVSGVAVPGGAVAATKASLIAAATQHSIPYHRLQRIAASYAWWKPALAVAITALGVFAVTQLYVFLLPHVLPGDVLLEVIGDLSTGDIDTATPASLAITLLSVAVWLPIGFLAYRLVGFRPVGMLSSIVGRIRWKWLLLMMALSVGMVIVAMVVASVIMAAALPLGDGDLSFGDRTWDQPGDELAALAAVESRLVPMEQFLASAAVILLLVPFQAAAEEYVFRGVFFQSFGSWLRWPLAAVLPGAVLFALGHVYDIWGLLSVSILGLGFAWLTWRTGGLEAAIALHSVYNAVQMLLLASGLLGTTVAEGSAEGSPWSLLYPVVLVLIAALVVHLISPAPWPSAAPSGRADTPSGVGMPGDGGALQ